SDGPLFVTVIVYVCVAPSPAVTLDTPSVLVTDRSASVVTLTDALAVLFALFGSVVAEATVAVLAIVLPFGSDGSTVARIVTTCDAPTAMSPSETVLPPGQDVDGVHVPVA